MAIGVPQRMIEKEKCICSNTISIVPFIWLESAQTLPQFGQFLRTYYFPEEMFREGEY